MPSSTLVQGAHNGLRPVDLGPVVERPAKADPGHVLVVDRRPLVRAGLATVLESTGRQIVEAAALFDAVSPGGSARSGPSAALVGPSGDLLGSEMLPVARAALGAPIVLVLFSDEVELITQALAAAADGYLLVDLADEDVIESTLAGVIRGEQVMPPELVGCGRRRRQAMLTERCVEVLRCLAAGLHDADVAKELGMSTSSVRKHIRTAQLRLRARTRTQAVAMAVRAGML